MGRGFDDNSVLETGEERSFGGALDNDLQGEQCDAREENVAERVWALDVVERDPKKQRGEPAGEAAVGSEVGPEQIKTGAEEERSEDGEPRDLPAIRGWGRDEKEEKSECGEIGEEVLSREMDEVSSEETPEFAVGQAIAGESELGGLGGEESRERGHD